VELQGRVKELQAQGLGLATISYDSRAVTQGFTAQRGITFPMLADPGSETIRRYGLLNPVAEMAFGPNRDDPDVKALVAQYVSVVGAQQRMIGMAIPGTLVLDRQGRVTSRLFEDSYIERTTMANLMLRVGGTGSVVSGSRLSTSHLDATAYPSDPAVAVGNRFSVVLDIAPRRGIHVYAPGATDYRVIGVTFASQPFVRIGPTRYPASEIYHFKPLNERVPVFQKPFRLVHEVVLEGSPAAQAELREQTSVTVSGTLDYQACDDKICYNPMSVPVSWTVSLKPLLREPTVPAR
jgi:peroxiredoxin